MSFSWNILALYDSFKFLSELNHSWAKGGFCYLRQSSGDGQNLKIQGHRFRNHYGFVIPSYGRVPWGQPTSELPTISLAQGPTKGARLKKQGLGEDTATHWLQGSAGLPQGPTSLICEPSCSTSFIEESSQRSLPALQKMPSLHLHLDESLLPLAEISATSIQNSRLVLLPTVQISETPILLLLQHSAQH